MVEEPIDQLPLIQSYSSGDVSGEPPKRTGNVWSAVAHIITGVIGAGVLSLAWSVAQLGWIGGPLCIILFAATTLVSSNLLSDCYRFPHPEYGTIRSSSYMNAVKLYLGEKRQKVCGILAYASLFGCATAYVITSAASISCFLMLHHILLFKWGLICAAGPLHENENCFVAEMTLRISG